MTFLNSKMRPEMGSENCTDIRGRIIPHGESYVPPTDPCKECTCRFSKPADCSSVICAPPKYCYSEHRVEGECCQYICTHGPLGGANINAVGNHHVINKTLDRIFAGGVPKDPTNDPTGASLGLRMIAATVTLCLICAVIIFVVHMSRRRKRLHRAMFDGTTLTQSELTLQYHLRDTATEENIYSEFFDQNDHFLPGPMCMIFPPPYTPPIPKPPDTSHFQLDPPPPYSPRDVEQDSNCLLLQTLSPFSTASSEGCATLNSNGLLLESSDGVVQPRIVPPNNVIGSNAHNCAVFI